MFVKLEYFFFWFCEWCSTKKCALSYSATWNVKADENRPILKSKSKPNLERHGESLQIEIQGLPGIQSVYLIHVF